MARLPLLLLPLLLVAAALLLLLLPPAACASSPTLNEQIYTERPTAVPCVRLLNATGVIGCQGEGAQQERERAVAMQHREKGREREGGRERERGRGREGERRAGSA